ncbi:MAG: hypothetical protein ACYDIC_07415 [Desulfobaccales bacterium]
MDFTGVSPDAASSSCAGSGAEGFLYVFRQTVADRYAVPAKIATAQGARTSLFVPEQGRLYLAAPQRGGQPAAVRVYGVQP